MKLNTSRFGETEISEDLIFNFIEPILGYENLKEFVLIDHSPESPFKWLQSVENPDVAFPITFPSYFGINYQFVVPEDKAKKLGLEGSENLISFNIVRIPQGNIEESTINLIGPIVINTENKKGLQLVLADSKYTVNHKLFGKEPFKKEKSEQEISK